MPQVVDLEPMVVDRRRLQFARTLAVGTLAGGLLAVFTSYLAHRGYQHTAANLGIAVGLVGSVLGAAQVYSLYEVAEPYPRPQGGGSILPQSRDPMLALAGVRGARSPWRAEVFGQAHRRKVA